MEKFNYTTPSANYKKKVMLHRIIFWLLILLILAGLAYGLFFTYKIYSVGKKVNIENNADSTFVETVKSFTSHAPLNLNGADKNQINILLLGIAGKGKPGQFLTDTIMVASLDTKTNRVALLSLPRDLFISIPNTTLQTKINSVYQFGLANSTSDSDAVQVVEETITSITGLDINYFVVMNFDGFQKAINDIGGINIVSERNIYDASYPGPNYSYETFELSKGFHRLDGATALKYARERHNDPEGDFGRAKRQQQIMQATKNKIFSAGTMLDVFALNNLFDTLGDNIKTDIQPEDFASFFELMKKIDTNNINNVVLDAWNKDSLLKVAHIQLGNVQAFALVPRIGNYSEIQDLAKNIFDLNALKRRQDEITQENATIAIINKSSDARIIQKIKKVLQENLNYKNVIILTDNNKHSVEKTTAYDLTNGQKPFTLDELATHLPATVSYDIPADLAKTLQNKTVDMALIVGKDLTSKYNIEEGTIDDLNRARDDQESQNLIKN
ncbi:MAG: hypothetical protein COX30_01595 [Candidatus Moranbacteria bacterium CG23_combo_of_CG06-09_8_20_14_all_39_10]|nr:MAG: hypothetical protein COX30_01595 [Candidatus Moranbacteria bacterium CG23_combo_of_CG06-09_8_20_14_all_39_10]